MKRNRLLICTGLLLLLALIAAPMAVLAAPPGPDTPPEDGGAAQPGEAVDSSPPAVTAPPSYGPATTVVAPGGLNFREGPSLSDRVIFVLHHGETVYPGGGPVYREGITWSFVRVYRYGTYYEGFCASAYLADHAQPQPQPQPVCGPTVKVTALWGLRLRSGPGTGYAIRRIVRYGTHLQSTGITQWGSGISWTKVCYQGGYYWAATKWLRDP